MQKCETAFGKLKTCNRPATFEIVTVHSHGRGEFSAFFCGYCKRMEMNVPINWYVGHRIVYRLDKKGNRIKNA